MSEMHQPNEPGGSRENPIGTYRVERDEGSVGTDGETHVAANMNEVILERRQIVVTLDRVHHIDGYAYDQLVREYPAGALSSMDDDVMDSLWRRELDAEGMVRRLAQRQLATPVDGLSGNLVVADAGGISTLLGTHKAARYTLG